MTTSADQPDWVQTLLSHYRSGSSNFFILHGNVDDVVGGLVGGEYRVETLTDYLGLRLLAGYDLVLHYDVGRGLRIHPGDDEVRESRMREILGRTWPGLSKLPHEARPMLMLMDRLATSALKDAADGLFRRTAFIFDYAELMCPAEGREPENLATFLNWARNPKIRRLEMIFILMTGSLVRLDPALVQSGYTTEIQVPMPDFEQRRRFINLGFPEWSEDAEKMASLSAGLTLTNLDNLLRLAGGRGGGDLAPDLAGLPFQERRVGLAEETSPETADTPAAAAADSNNDTWAFLARAKKELIEAQVPGLLEFVEPKLDLSLVAGHAAAKARLAEDAELIKSGRLEAAPMGYLICGPVGVGKTFLAMCYAGTVGIPCVTLRNFRGKYVGETEANLERILRVLRELGPVAVIIDEADAAVGDRSESGDSGTGSRVFAQLAAQMGDTSRRGLTIWFLLTCRPDLLPVDLKRQGRCEEHIPLFYPNTAEEQTDMFLAMGRKLGLGLTPEDAPAPDPDRSLSGADIESLLTRVRRVSLVENREVDRALIEEVLADFRSPRSPEHELQVLAAVMETSDLRYLPPDMREEASEPEGWAELSLRYQALKTRLELA